MNRPEALDSSDSGADQPIALSPLGKLIGKMDLEPFRRETAIRWLIAFLLLCWTIDLAGRYGFELGFFSELIRDLSGMAVVVVLFAAALYVFSRVHSIPSVRITLLAGVFLIILYQVSNLLDQIPALQNYPLLGKGHLQQTLINHFLLMSGGLLMMAALCIALFETESVLRELDTERRRLSEQVRARRHAQRELHEAHAVLERKVQLRTSELAQLNEQLRLELSERKRTEAALSLRLRYEEGLASCSQILLREAESAEALKRALHELLLYSGASRVYLCENIEEAGQGLSFWMTLEAHDHRQCSGLALVRATYTGGFSRWAGLFQEGQIIAGSLESLPPEEQPWLEEHGAQAMLLVPVRWEGSWQGFLGFEDTQTAHGWSPEEIRILRTVAEMVGAFKARQRVEESLHSAYDSLERRVAERTAELTRANQRLEQEAGDRRRAQAEKAQLESQLIQIQKMQAIGTLAGGIAHDFNNILASILGYAELALRKMETDNPFRRHFQEVLKAGNRAKELVRQILLFSRQSEQERAPVYMHLLAKDVLTLLQASCPSNIEIHTYIDSEAGAVMGDPVLLYQIILNLCTNAERAMRDRGGALELRLEPVHLEQELHTSQGHLGVGDYVRILVSDTGHGMDPGIMARIFEPFFTTRNVGEGTGMGLAIVHGIVSSIGGAIVVRSAPGEGTCFEIYLPRYQSEEAVDFQGEVPAAKGDERILVVDDEPQLVALWCEVLEQYGYTPTAFHDGIDALDHFRKDPSQYDLALLDQKMPGLTGAELARELLTIRPELPIILATGFSESITPEQAREIGVRDFVYKPILGTDITIAIRKVLDADA
jgi:signal transduction histidine kinase/ActR/RegA family two-component response regulator